MVKDRFRRLVVLGLLSPNRILPPVFTAQVQITGSNIVGSTLTGVPGTILNNPATVQYQWYRNGVAIAGATNLTYVTQAADKALGVSNTFGVKAFNSAAPAGVQSISNPISVVIDITATIASKSGRVWRYNQANSFSDAGLTTAVVDGAEWFTTKELRNTNANNNMVWIGGDGTATGTEHASHSSYSLGTRPRWRSAHGGVIRIENTFNRKGETVTVTPAISGAATGILFIMKLAGTFNEGASLGSNVQTSVRDSNNTNYRYGQRNTEYNPGAGGIARFWTMNMYVIECDAAGLASLEVNRAAYNGGGTGNIGTGNITEAAIGGNAHAMDHLQFGMMVMPGTLTSNEKDDIRKYMEVDTGLTIGEYPTTYPLVTMDDGNHGTVADTPFWNATAGIKRWEPPKISLHNGVKKLYINWFHGGTVNGVQYEKRTNVVGFSIDNIVGSYATIAAMLADQANQVTSKRYFVQDASAAPNLSCDWGIYEKGAASTANLNDYSLQDMFLRRGDFPALFPNNNGTDGVWVNVEFIAEDLNVVLTPFYVKSKFKQDNVA